MADCRHKLDMSLLVDPHIAMFSADVGKLFSILLKMRSAIAICSPSLRFMLDCLVGGYATKSVIHCIATVM